MMAIFLFLPRAFFPSPSQLVITSCFSLGWDESRGHELFSLPSLPLPLSLSWRVYHSVVYETSQSFITLIHSSLFLQSFFFCLARRKRQNIFHRLGVPDRETMHFNSAYVSMYFFYLCTSLRRERKRERARGRSGIMRRKAHRA